MAQQEEKNRSSGSCGGGSSSATRSSKKQKHKKPPQRGLGVAQLERLRLEELRKKDNPPFYPSPPSSTINSFSPSASLPNFPVASEFEPSDSFFSNIPSVPNMDFAAFIPPGPSLSASKHSNYDAESRSRVRDLVSNMSSPLDPDHAMGGQEQGPIVGSDHPPLLSYQLEPPSNQSHHGSAAASFSPQGEKRSGVKTSYPSTFENHPAIIPFRFKIRKLGNPIMNGPEEPSSALRENSGEGPSRSSSMLGSSSADSVKENHPAILPFRFNIRKLGNPIMNGPEEPSSFSRIDNLRENSGEGPSRLSSMLGSDSVKENKVNESKYLTIAPPVDNPPHSQRFASGAPRGHNPHRSFEFPQYTGYPVGFVYRYAPGWTDQPPFQWPYYNFLPPATPPDDTENAHNNDGSKDTSESIDLNLKL